MNVPPESIHMTSYHKLICISIRTGARSTPTDPSILPKGVSRFLESQRVLKVCDLPSHSMLNMFYHILSVIFHHLVIQHIVSSSVCRLLFSSITFYHLLSSSFFYTYFVIFPHLLSSSIFYHVASAFNIFRSHIYVHLIIYSYISDHICSSKIKN